jgi:hypothetical protein
MGSDSVIMPTISGLYGKILLGGTHRTYIIWAEHELQTTHRTFIIFLEHEFQL